MAKRKKTVGSKVAKKKAGQKRQPKSKRTSLKMTPRCIGPPIG